MSPNEFIDHANFHKLSGNEKILLAAWYLHHYAEKERFSRADLRSFFLSGNVLTPDISVYLPRIEANKPPKILRNRSEYRLEGSVRKKLDLKFGHAPSTVAVSSLLTSLPDKIASLAEQEFLREALACYRVGAYRAATIMAWNLAFDHFCNWIRLDQVRLDAFNAVFLARYPKKTSILVRADFEDIKEYDIIEFAKLAKIINKNMHSILSEKLKRRNMAAHPSSIKIQQHQADDTISDLINNILLPLA